MFDFVAKQFVKFWNNVWDQPFRDEYLSGINANCPMFSGMIDFQYTRDDLTIAFTHYAFSATTM
jgi:hypothetical protein